MISRFWGFGHTPDAPETQDAAPIRNTPTISRFVAENKKELKADTPIEVVNPEYPNTLDLRKYWKRR